jgi:hypothetical protein
MNRPMPTSETITLQVPFRIVKRGGRKAIHPSAETPTHRQIESTIVKALARAFRWKRMLESGEFNTIAELATQEKIAFSYMSRILRLTLLSPKIIEAILHHPEQMNTPLAILLSPFPMEWRTQEAKFLNKNPEISN